MVPDPRAQSANVFKEYAYRPRKDPGGLKPDFNVCYELIDDVLLLLLLLLSLLLLSLLIYIYIYTYIYTYVYTYAHLSFNTY